MLRRRVLLASVCTTLAAIASTLVAPASAASISASTAPLASVSLIAPTTKKILHFSDVHLNISASFNATDSALFPIRYGQDATVSLLESALAYAQQVLPEPDLFLYTGDHVAHGLFSDDYIAKALETNVATIEKYYPPSSSESDSDMLETTAILGNADGST